MKKELITRLHKSFEDYVHNEDGIEYWFARDLQSLLGYVKWDKFTAVIEKAKTSCQTAGNAVEDHFLQSEKMVDLGSGAVRSIPDFKLTRYACYLIAQNGDSSKEEIAFAQAYFAIQTRKAEVIEERLRDLKRLEKREYLAEKEKILAGIVFERGVDSQGFARIKSRGDQALFGGHSTQQMKDKLQVPAKRPLADFLPTVTLTAKALADEMTELNVLGKDLKGESPISGEHVESNRAVRRAMVDRGIYPEKLPPAEDIKKVESRLNSERKKLPKQAKAIGHKKEKQP